MAIPASSCILTCARPIAASCWPRACPRRTLPRLTTALSASRASSFLKTIKSPAQRKAWFVAILADAIQIVGMPLFAEGAFSPLDTALDVVVGAILIKLLGWHWAFLPTFAAELVPGLDLLPTWTAAVYFATRNMAAESEAEPNRVRSTEPEILEPGPAPARRV